LDARAKARWTVDELEGAFVLAAFLEGRLAAAGDEREPGESRALGDVAALGRHVGNLAELVAAELRTRMTGDEWANRELQLREGCHFRWIRPGMAQGSLLLAARPRRRRAGGEGRAAAKARPKLSKLVRGRPQSTTPDSRANDDEDDLLAALRSKRERGSQPSDSDASMDSDDASATSSGGSGSDSDGASASDGFVVSDSDGGARRAKRRKSAQLGDASRRAGTHALGSSRPQNARQRIAERLKIKL
ncbi:hypothetical protein IWW55_005448, partial [Coemansia sp. RSA 2706]